MHPPIPIFSGAKSFGASDLAGFVEITLFSIDAGAAPITGEDVTAER